MSRSRIVPLLLVSALGLAGCDGDANQVGAQPSPTTTASTIPQPQVPRDLPLAPDSDRVDLQYPTFTHPTEVTNPLFPVSSQRSVVFAGRVDDLPFRTEVTLLPYTRVFDWGGQRVETLVSQYTAFLDGRLQEVAYDYYAQADDGSVWYFGEDVSDLEHGRILTKEGTWLAGKDGPAQMIMAGEPQVGDVWRSENIPGIAFEEVRVESVNRDLAGPFGAIAGGLVARELHMDGETEHKLYAPGYGEFFTGGGGDVEALALAIPTDGASTPEPAALDAVRSLARQVYDAESVGQPGRAQAAYRQLVTNHARLGAGVVPRRIAPELAGAIDRLGRELGQHDRQTARTEAIQVQRWALDVQLRYRDTVAIDRARLALWADQIVVDADASDAAEVNGDVFAVFFLRDRITSGLDQSLLQQVNRLIGGLELSGAAGSIDQARRQALALRNLPLTP